MNEKTMQSEEMNIRLQESSANDGFEEIVSLRGANKVVKQGKGGKRKEVMFARPVFSRGEDGAFQKTEKIKAIPEGKRLVGKADEFTASFSGEETTSELFSVEKGEHKLTVLTKDGCCCAKEKADSVVFENAKEDVDFTYDVLPDGVKEVIVIKQKKEEYRYGFCLETENLVPRLSANGKELLFVSTQTGEDVFEIPAPFMVDAKGEHSDRVFYEIVFDENNNVELCVVADSEWINASQRVFPVSIDPQIMLSGSVAINTFSYDDASKVLTKNTVHKLGYNEGKMHRMYMTLNLPTLPPAVKITKAEVVITQATGSLTGDVNPAMLLYKVNGSLQDGMVPPALDDKMLDYVRLTEVAAEGENKVKYAFNIAQFLDEKSRDGNVVNLAFKLADETDHTYNCVTLYGASSSVFATVVEVEYEADFDVTMDESTHTHSVGRLGTVGIGLQNGNLMVESEDFAWAGTRLPVTLKHLYTGALAGKQFTGDASIALNTANFAAMKMGQGWRMNVMQSVVPATFFHEGKSVNGYIYMDETGLEHYLVESFAVEDKCDCACESGHCDSYRLFKGIDDGDLKYDLVKKELYVGDETFTFDESGRLVEVKDQFGNKQIICYVGGQIDYVLDGAGRKFDFIYSNGFLTKVKAPDNTAISYAYTAQKLSAITYPDRRKAEIGYSDSGNIVSISLRDKDDMLVYSTQYEYTDNRVVSVKEFGYEYQMSQLGQHTTYEYSLAAGSTTVKTFEKQENDETAETTSTVYVFNEEGNVDRKYVYTEETGLGQVENQNSGTIHPYVGDDGVGIVSNINNLLRNHSFDDLTHWNAEAANASDFRITTMANQGYAKFGRYLLRMASWDKNAVGNGVYQQTDVLPEGDYVFSVYLRPLTNMSGSDSAFLRVTDTTGSVLAESESLTKSESDYVRLFVPFTLAESKAVQVHILMNGKFTMHVDGAQLENNQSANEYNMLENGNFELGDCGWNVGATSGSSIVQEDNFNMSHALKLQGDINCERKVSQSLFVKHDVSTKESFTLSGWAKGSSLPLNDKGEGMNPSFCLKAIIHYKDGEQQVETANFTACVDNWQLASVEFEKERYAAVKSLEIVCEYNYNNGDAYFDDIQLIRNSYETHLTSDDFDSETNQSTEPEDVETEAAEPGTEEGTNAFEEVMDAFGNALTETTFADGEFGTMYRSFAFDENGNNLVHEVDARGGTTDYVVDEKTSRNKEVIDRMGNKTAYEYDVNGRTTKVTNLTPQRNEQGELVEDTCGNIVYDEVANVSYNYDAFDNMTEIVRGDGMKYVLGYNAFHNLKSIGVAGKEKPLVQYTYKDGNGKLKQMTYANGHRMEATYNGLGQMIGETWYNEWDTVSNRYHYVYDGAGNIVQTLDITNGKMYNYKYEKDALVSAEEYSAVFTNDMVTSKTLVNSISYRYNDDGEMVEKVVKWTNVDGVPQEETLSYEYPENGDPIVSFDAKNKGSIFHSKTDTFGRKVFEEMQLGRGFASRQFAYYSGEVAVEHKENAKVKSSPTTRVVKEIVFSDGRTISYEYDKEERITKVTDSVEGITEYTYDALGQLLTETKNGQLINQLTYDNYGNICSKNNVPYYYDTKWKDLLVRVGDKWIDYDEQGNPIIYLDTNTLCWGKGRQLETFIKCDENYMEECRCHYTYNGNGIRTSKTVNNVCHNYVLEDAKIVGEFWQNKSLIPLYNSQDEVVGITYNGRLYAFLKNLQGDIIALTDETGETVARYSYDAWGVPTVLEDNTDQQITLINPFLYRSYYYDWEIGMYYLQSRYFDPYLGRFINSDDVEIISSANEVVDYSIFSYSLNNPIGFSDTTGNSWLKDLWRSVKKGFSSAVRWVKDGCKSVGNYFKNTVWKKWLVKGVWNTFCKKWVWQTFCKEWVYKTFLKKWVWQTFCKKWTWNTFCKKWVWQTFCKKWVWQTFFKDWIANKALNWLKKNWKRVVDGVSVFFGSVSWVVEGLSILGLVTLSGPAAIALFIFSGLCLIWDVLRFLNVL